MLVLMLCILCRQTVTSQELVFSAVKDNTLYSEADSSNGKGIYLFSGLNNGGNERRAMLKFDLSQLQAPDSIISTELKLYASRTISGEISAGIHKMKKDWGEGASDAKFEEGGGATAKPCDATWNYAFFDTSAWTNAGGDFEITASATLLTGEIGSYSWEGDQLTSDVHFWIQQPDSNFGWILILEPADFPTAKRFNSREHEEFPPQLIVNVAQANSLVQSRENNLSVFPNPSSGILHIRGENGMHIGTIRIIDMNGRELNRESFRIRRISDTEVSLDIRRKGTYVIELNNIFHKIVVIVQ